MAVTETYGPFDGVTWTQSQWYRNAPTWAPSGVIDTGIPANTSAGALGLSFNGLTANVAAGRAWVRGAGYELAGGSKALAIAANTNTSLSRRDRIVLRRDLAAKTVTMIVLQGTPSATPVTQSLSQVETGQWDVPLFNFLVPPNSGTVVSGVVDERLIVSDGGAGLVTPVVGTRAWKFLRSSGNNSDQFQPGSFFSLIAGTAAAAPAGAYLITAVLSLSATASASGNLRVLAAGTNVSADIKEDLTTSARGVQFTTTYTHTGGDLLVSAAFQASQTGIINTAGSQIDVAYLGPQ